MGELTFFIGLQVKQLPKGIFIIQCKYVTKILKNFSLFDHNPEKTPMSTSLKIYVDLDVINVNSTMYKGMIAVVLYLKVTHPDIMFTTNICALFQAKPKKSHILIVKRIF